VQHHLAWKKLLRVVVFQSKCTRKLTKAVEPEKQQQQQKQQLKTAMIFSFQNMHKNILSRTKSAERHDVHNK